MFHKKLKYMNSLVNIACINVAGLKLKTGSGVVVYGSKWPNKHLRLKICNGAGVFQYITVTNDTWTLHQLKKLPQVNISQTYIYL